MTALATLVHRASLLLLDFDGPVCRLFSHPSASAVAAQLSREIAGCSPPQLGRRPSLDPLDLVRQPARGPRHDIAERLLQEAEVNAATTSQPTDGAFASIRAARQRGMPIAIVSNNSREAVHRFLGIHKMEGEITAVVGRDPRDAGRMKPSAFLLNEALRATGYPPSAAVFVGDSVTDAIASESAGIPFIGLANRRSKIEAFSDKAATVILEMPALARALSST